MGGESFDYKFGNKNNWRRWVWNRIAEKVDVPVKDAIVLYMAGELDHDRTVAIKKGFKAHNLISIERDRAVADALRDKRVLTICANIIEVLQSWPLKKKVHAIYLDMCSGLENSLVDVLRYAPFMPPFFDAVWIFNLMRGRDRSTGWLRDELAINFGREKHRGIILKEWLNLYLGISAIRERHPEWIHEREDGANEVNLMRLASYTSVLNTASNPQFNSYKSASGQIFDSLIWISPFRVLVTSEKKEWALSNHSHSLRNKTVCRQVSAILAHRTMRMNNF